MRTFDKISQIGKARFGGIIRSNGVQVTSTAQAMEYIENISPWEFEALFNEWLMQIWIFENEVPWFQEELDLFDKNCLRKLFLQRFVKCDYALLRPQIGVSLDQFMIYSRLMNKTTFHYVLNRESILQKELEWSPYFTMESGVFRLLFNMIVLQREKYWPNDINPHLIGIPMLLTDKEISHIAYAYAISGVDLIYYDSWPGNLSFFSEGQNKLMINSAKRLSASIWSVPLWDIWRCFNGFQIPTEFGNMKEMLTEMENIKDD